MAHPTVDVLAFLFTHRYLLNTGFVVDDVCAAANVSRVALEAAVAESAAGTGVRPPVPVRPRGQGRPLDLTRRPLIAGDALFEDDDDVFSE